MNQLSAEAIAIVLTVAGLIGSGGIAYGHLASKTDDFEKRITAVEQAPIDIAAIKASQSRIEVDISEMRKDQRALLRAVMDKPHR